MTDTTKIIRTVMKETYGRDLSCYDEPFLKRTLHIRCSLTGLKTLAEYGEYLSRQPEEARAFAQSLVVSYSEFFRDTLTFAVLETVVIPLLQKRSNGRTIRIWSVGCSAGEEAYSLAILFEELVQGLGIPVPYQIFATTMNAQDLERAQAGVYEAMAVRNVRLSHLERYFQRVESRYAVNPGLHRQIDFSLYDLLDHAFTSPPSSIYGEFDLMVCSNVLMYYQQEIREQMVKKLFQSLVPGGFFSTSEAEKDCLERISGCQPLISSTAVYRRGRVLALQQMDER
ncbi:MAG: protein-glutamate O-methyltransferase CheR [bacterium]